MQIKRLQGKEFANKYHKLIEVAYSISNNGNICKFYRYPYATKVTVSHWLNDDEKNYFYKMSVDIPRIDDIAKVKAMRF